MGRDDPAGKRWRGEGLTRRADADIEWDYPPCRAKFELIKGHASRVIGDGR